jgi:branched-chain amino acid transport system permease protein
MTFYYANIVYIQATFTGLLLALSIQIPLRFGVFSFSGAGCYGLGAYACGILVKRYDMSWPAAVTLSVLGGIAVSLLLGALVYRLSGLYLAMATVAFDLIIGVAAINGGDLTGASTGLFGVLTPFGTGQLVVIALVALALLALTELGRVRRRVEAVREDPELAASMGISVRRYRMAAFGMSGALGALGGATNILLRTYVGPLDIGFPLIVLALTMIVVGGSRSWRGAVIGAIVFTWLPAVLAVIGDWQDLVYGVIVAATAIFLPTGVYGLYTSFKRRWKQSRRDPGTTRQAGSGDDHAARLATGRRAEPGMEATSS